MIRLAFQCGFSRPLIQLTRASVIRLEERLNPKYNISFMSIASFEAADRALKLALEKKENDRLLEQKRKEKETQELLSFAKGIFEWVSNFVKSDFFKTVFSDPSRMSVNVYQSGCYQCYQVTRDGALRSLSCQTDYRIYSSPNDLVNYPPQCELSSFHSYLISGRAVQSIIQQAISEA